VPVPDVEAVLQVRDASGGWTTVAESATFTAVRAAALARMVRWGEGSTFEFSNAPQRDEVPLLAVAAVAARVRAQNAAVLESSWRRAFDPDLVARVLAEPVDGPAEVPACLAGPRHPNRQSPAT
jgi:hypothetical protein